MALEKAVIRFKEFHLKDPKEVVTLKSVIPAYVMPIGFAVQISYNSNKWQDDKKWSRYIHWWDNPTLICVPESVSKYNKIDDFWSDNKMFLGEGRNEVTFLGYAIDFNVSAKDTSKMKITTNESEEARMKGSYCYTFNDTPGRSNDYVVCSPNGRIVYVIADNDMSIYAFINSKCKVTRHGIEG